MFFGSVVHELGVAFASCLSISLTRVGLFRIEAIVMHPMYRSGTISSMHLHALIADLRWKVQLFNSDIAEEEERACVFDVKNVAYPLVAKDLRERRDNLLATIATLEAQLIEVDPLARAA
jgi:hypothetical protein